jgi:hypothetical protein
MIYDELSATLEHVVQANFADRTLEYIILLDRDHRQPATFGVDRVPLAREFFFLCEQFLARRQPPMSRNYFKKFDLDSFKPWLLGLFLKPL